MNLNLHQGWSIAFVLFLCFTITVGVLQYSFGVFVTPLETAFGWTRTEINGSVALFSFTGIAGLVAGPLLDKYGSKPVMVFSVILLGISFVFRPFITELWHYYFLSLVSYAGMPGVVMLPVGKLIGMWFPDTRGRAMGFTTAGANFGGFIFSNITDPLIVWSNWQNTFLIYGIMFLCLIPLILIAIKDSPSVDISEIEGESNDQNSGLSAKEALKTKTFFYLIIALLFASVAYQSVLTQVVPHLENIGISRTTAGAALGVIAIFGMVGKVFLGYLTEFIPSRYVFVGALIAQILAMMIMIFAGTGWLLWSFVPIYGIAFGGMGSLIPLIVQDSFGLKNFARIFWLVNFFILPAALLGPPLVGISFDATGSYSTAFIWISGGFLVGCWAFIMAKPAGNFFSQ
ncbi:MAG: MFS transporter [Chloroflexota bacterium]|nr:MFS transporter [Chloroflexota bacterium]